MKTQLLKLIAIMLVLTIGVSACTKEVINGEIFDVKLCCSHINVEHFYKTAPTINGYLSSLPKNWNDERKIQAFVDWLNSTPCITVVGFDIIPNWCWTPPVPFTTFVYIRMLLDENGVEKEITLNVNKETKTNLFIATGYVTLGWEYWRCMLIL